MNNDPNSKFHPNRSRKAKQAATRQCAGNDEKPRIVADKNIGLNGIWNKQTGNEQRDLAILLYMLLHALAAFATGLMGAAFLVLAVYLAWNEIRLTGNLRLKFLMMPMMNTLIAGVLLFNCRLLVGKTRKIRAARKSGTVTLPDLRATRHDILAMTAFLLVVAIAGWLVWK